MTPTAVMLPRYQKFGESEKLRLKNPMTVVTLVITTGRKLIRRLSRMATRCDHAAAHQGQDRHKSG